MYVEEDESGQKESVFVPGIPLSYVFDGPKSDAWLKQQPALILQKV